MPYFAGVFAQADQGWLGTETDLAEAEGIDDVTDLMREVALETGGDPVLLLLEEDDQWFVVMRLDEQEDLRVFLSDSQATVSSGLAGLLDQSVETTAWTETGGDPTLLEDLGVDTKRLLELSERVLPGDALLAIAEEIGFAEEFDRLRD